MRSFSADSTPSLEDARWVLHQRACLHGIVIEAPQVVARPNTERRTSVPKWSASRAYRTSLGPAPEVLSRQRNVLLLSIVRIDGRWR